MSREEKYKRLLAAKWSNMAAEMRASFEEKATPDEVRELRKLLKLGPEVSDLDVEFIYNELWKTPTPEELKELGLE